MVVYHLEKVSGKPGWIVNGTRLLGSFQGKIVGSNRKSEKLVLFFRTECTKQSVLHFFGKAIFDNSFRLSWPFFVKWNCTNGRHDSGTRVSN